MTMSAVLAAAAGSITGDRVENHDGREGDGHAADCDLPDGHQDAVVTARPVGRWAGLARLLDGTRPIGGADLEAVLAHMGSRGLRYCVPVAAPYKPAALGAWLERRGFTRGYAWMKFSRACGERLEAPTDLEVRVVGRDHGADFGRVVAEGFGLPAAIAAWVSALPGRAHWVCVMAFAGSAPAAAGAAFVQGEYAWLGFGATLPASRRRGAQNALLARRLAEAAARGARTAVTETGERLPDKPSNSYRNILRAGFHERYLRHNYLSPQAA